MFLRGVRVLDSGGYCGRGCGEVRVVVGLGVGEGVYREGYRA